jgi:MFS family permease
MHHPALQHASPSVPRAGAAGLAAAAGGATGESVLSHRGWRVVAGAFLQSAAAFFVAYSFAAFALPIEGAFHAARADVVAIYGLYTGLMLALAPLGGMMADRFGTRASCVLGTLIMATALVLASLADGLRGLQFCYGALLGIGLAFVYTPCFAVVPRWFTRRRGLAAGIATSGAAVGTILGVPLAEALIGSVGWQQALSLLAIGLLAVGLAGALLISDAPAARGPGQAEAPRLAEVARGWRFRGVLLANLIGGLALLIPLGQLVPHARSMGLDGPMIAGLMSLVGLGSLAGRLLLGPLADRIGRTRAMGLLNLALGASFGLWLLADGLPLLSAFALAYGVFYGSIIALRASVVADLFRCRSMSTLTGVFASVVGAGSAAGTLLLGVTFDLTGTYGAAIVITGMAAIVSGLLYLRLAAQVR